MATIDGGLGGLTNQRTVELIIGLLSPEQQREQREQLELMKKLREIPIEKQRPGRISDDFSRFKNELTTLENLQKLIESRNKHSYYYQQLQNKQKSSKIISKNKKENESFVKEQMQKFARGEPNFVAERDTHYRIKPPHGKHCYIVCKKCNFLSTTRHFKNHYRRHEITEQGKK